MKIYFLNLNIQKDDLVNISSSYATSNGILKEGKCINEVDVVNPTVTVILEKEVNSNTIPCASDYNIMYIPLFNRFYFINEYKYTSFGNECNIIGESAVLINNYNEISNTPCVVNNSTRTFDSNINSNIIPTYGEDFVNAQSFKQLPMEESFILTVLGG